MIKLNQMGLISELSGVSGSGGYVNYSYDALDRVTNVTNPDSSNVTVVFDRWLVSTFDGNGRRKDYELDAYGRIIRVQEFNGDFVLDDGVVRGYNTSYAYNAAGQLLQINDTLGNQFIFAYDTLGRRVRLNDPDIGEWNYSYDLAGNLVSQAGGGGNLISGDGYFREYNSLNQLVKIRNGSGADSPLLEQYYYDPYGQRVKIWRNDTAGTVVYTPFLELMQVRNSSGVYNFTYIYDGSTLVARVEPDNTVHYYHPDHLGSTSLITDGNGDVIETTLYEPFGTVISGGSSDVKLYTGQFSDGLTNQYYYGARYYKPFWGKFVQADGLLVNVYDPQTFNRYSYVRNSPYSYIDPTGNVFVFAAAAPYVYAAVAAGVVAGGALATTFVLETIFANEAEVVNDVPSPTLPAHLPPAQAVVENTYKDVLFSEGTINDYPGVQQFDLPAELPGASSNENDVPLKTDPGDRKDKVSKKDSPIWKQIRENSEPIKGNEQYRKIGDYAYRWDKTHGDIEVYKVKGGNKLEEIGSRNSESGELYRKSKGRTVKLK